MDIHSYSELRSILYDIKSQYKNDLGNCFIDWLFQRPGRKIYRYIYHTRCLEYFDRQHSLLGKFCCAYHYFFRTKLAYQLDYQIPPHTCGKNLKLVHWGVVIINAKSRIGNNVKIYPNVVIGSTSEGVPVIGNNVWIGSGAKIFGNISIGNNVIVSPNTVINKSVPSNSIVGGIPSKVLKQINETNYLDYSDYLGPINDKEFDE